ncbi:MAG: hypothetical protein LC720_02675, partial [Actinobacteria bacterium]|nr:hypothetical protein [Actinomycetota bacterium]
TQARSTASVDHETGRYRMPETERDQQKTPELPDQVLGDQTGLSRSGSPDWGGVDLSLGDHADATGGHPADEGGEVAGDK